VDQRCSQSTALTQNPSHANQTSMFPIVFRYLAARTDAPAKRRYLLYERALKALPGSYKVIAEQGLAWVTVALTGSASCSPPAV
jgi:hypothetical protein